MDHDIDERLVQLTYDRPVWRAYARWVHREEYEMLLGQRFPEIDDVNSYAFPRGKDEPPIPIDNTDPSVRKSTS